MLPVEGLSRETHLSCGLTRSKLQIRLEACQAHSGSCSKCRLHAKTFLTCVSALCRPLFASRSGSCLEVLSGHSEDVTCVVLTSRGRFAVTGSLDGTAQVWDTQAQDVSNTDVHDGKVRLEP